jgi:NADH-quinone oxidoreductase subunit G
VSPLDPAAIFDEIQRLVPGYGVPRLHLLAGNDVATHVRAAGGTPRHAPELILPAADTLFTSGTLGRYSNTLNSVVESRRTEPADKEVAADD